MTFEAIACNHHQLIGNHLVQHFLRIGEDQHRLWSARIVEFVEAFFGQVLSCVWKNQVTVTDASLPFLPSRVEDRRVDKSHTRDVWIRFGGYIESAGPRSFDHGKALRSLTQASAIDVDNVQRSAADGRGR